MDFNLDWQGRTSRHWPEISYEIRPLRVWAFLELMAFWEARGEQAQPADTARLSAADSLRLMQVAERILPEHVRHLRGVRAQRDGQAQALEPQDLCTEGLFLPLVGEMIAELVALSEVDAAAEKN